MTNQIISGTGVLKRRSLFSCDLGTVVCTCFLSYIYWNLNLNVLLNRIMTVFDSVNEIVCNILFTWIIKCSPVETSLTGSGC